MSMKDNQIKKLAEQIVDIVYSADTTYGAIEEIEDILNKFDIKLKTGPTPTHELTDENAAWVNRWDYSGWRKRNEDDDVPLLQNDWNATLMTQINQVSAQIHRASLRASVDTIKTSPWMEALFLTLDFYKDGVIGGKYEVIYDETIEDDKIFLYNKYWNDLLYIPKLKEGETTTNDKGVEETEISEVTFSHISTYTEEEVSSFNNKLLGCIVIDNLPKKHNLAIDEYY